MALAQSQSMVRATGAKRATAPTGAVCRIGARRVAAPSQARKHVARTNVQVRLGEEGNS